MPLTSRRVLIPKVPVVSGDWTSTAILSPSGEITVQPSALAGQSLASARPILCHAPSTAAHLKVERFQAADVLELFAFVHPTVFCLPTVSGLADAASLPLPESLEDQPLTLITIVKTLLRELTYIPDVEAKTLVGLARAMNRGGWLWGPSVLSALGDAPNSEKGYGPAAGLRVWMNLPEWEERAPPPPPGSKPIAPEKSEARLAELIGNDAETRIAQRTYTRDITASFQPHDSSDQPLLALVEAGTGIGKTLGYIAPASLWAQQNSSTVWLSTFTRNLQRQLDQELGRLYPDPDQKRRKVVIRKGRENYLCLLNYEEALNRLQANPFEAIALGLIARWTGATRNGDMVGGDLPGWLPEILTHERTLGLTDRRGECIYAACSHYQKCFIERTVRRARHAEIVVANHALVMTQAALGGLDDAVRPTRYVFDEGHHIFAAADSAFSAHLSGLETADLRRWLLGAEGSTGRSRGRGLKRRAEELMAEGGPISSALTVALDETLAATHCLPAPGWRNRIRDEKPRGPAEVFLSLVQKQVIGRSDAESPYSLETDITPPIDGLLAAAEHLENALAQLEGPIRRLISGFAVLLDTKATELSSNARTRIEALVRTMERRGLLTVTTWRAMLAALKESTPPEFVDWLAVERKSGHNIDAGLHRHWVDPTLPFARALADDAHGLAITSATLLNGDIDYEADWEGAEKRVGASHLSPPVVRTSLASPFDYANCTRVIVITDVRKGDMDQVASAYRELFFAAGGGALGLFTAITRLREVHRKIAAPMEKASLPLYAQHVDAMDISTLVDIFRAEKNACLLGTDAIREGVDVPGQSLRMVVFERVPWPRPNILHKARREAFGKRRYDDAITRLRLKQAFGRLIRRQTDRGVFILMDSMMPSRLKGAFPKGTPILRLGLKDAIDQVETFLDGP
ncbi:MAG: helicase [Candidatus Marinimicrobia bacterium]|nr:helicase [Candidatus Neomarinimicrobiota bacterium]